METKELVSSDFEMCVKASRLALVDYYASWCGSCRMALPMYKRVAEMVGADLLKIDADKNPEIRTSIDLKTLPTLALVKDGVIVGTISTTKEDSLLEFLKEHGIQAQGV